MTTRAYFKRLGIVTGAALSLDKTPIGNCAVCPSLSHSVPSRPFLIIKLKSIFILYYLLSSIDGVDAPKDNEAGGSVQNRAQRRQ